MRGDLLNGNFLFYRIIFVAIFLSSCTSIDVQKSHELSMGHITNVSDDEKKIHRAQSLHDMGEIEAAISVLKTLVDDLPYTQQKDRAYELLVEWLLQLRRDQEAKRIASYFLSHHKDSDSADKIIQLFKNVGDIRDESDSSAAGHIDEEEQLHRLENAVRHSENQTDRDANFDRLANFVLREASLALAERTMRNSSLLSFGLSNARLALHHFHLGNLREGKEHLKTALSRDLGSNADGLRSLMHTILQLEEVDGRSVGILLPLSGSFAPFGKRILLAMSIALNQGLDFKGGDYQVFVKDGMRIVVADSKSDPQQAQSMVEKLVLKEHVAMIIGEITTDPSLLSAQLCQRFRVPMLSLSRHPSVSDIGSFIFSFNSSPRQHIEHLVNYAMAHRGHRRFGILMPRHNYGMYMSKLFFDAVSRSGGAVTAMEAYDAHVTTFFDPVRKLIGKFYLDDRPEYVECIKVAKEGHKGTNSAVVKECRESIKPVIDFDALFIPEFNKLAFLIPVLIQEDILVSDDKQVVNAYSIATKTDNPQYVQLLGTNSWNSEGLLEKIGNKIDGSYFVDSVSFEEDDEMQRFALAFAEQETSPVTSLEVFAHDALRLSLHMLNENIESREQLHESLLNFRGKVGLLSDISFLGNRELDVRETGFVIKEGKARVIGSSKQPL